MTSAPRSARMVVATGPAMKLAASMTRRPSSNGIAESGSARAAPRRRRALGEKAEREQHHTDGDRRVGDIEGRPVPGAPVHVHEVHHGAEARAVDQVADGAAEDQADGDHAGEADRKSTRLNSSHITISYAVFCLKKKSTTRARATSS